MAAASLDERCGSPAGIFFAAAKPLHVEGASVPATV
jgi:hypothetical protein